MDLEEGGLEDCEEISGNNNPLVLSIFFVVHNLITKDLRDLCGEGSEFVCTGISEAHNSWSYTSIWANIWQRLPSIREYLFRII